LFGTKFLFFYLTRGLAKLRLWRAPTAKIGFAAIDRCNGTLFLLISFHSLNCAFGVRLRRKKLMRSNSSI
jgi:hypothetical protein